MPEGDTIHALAGRLNAVLGGSRIRAVLSPRVPGIARIRGWSIQRVFPVGKHAILELDPGDGASWGLRTHLGMDGRWRLRPRQATRAPLPHRLSLALSTETHTAVLAAAREVELAVLSAMWAPAGSLGRLGPDVLRADLPLDLVVERARQSPWHTVAEVLLDQRVSAGIGNIYKNETLFLEGVLPATPLCDLPDAVVAALFATASRLMRANLDGRPRCTTEGLSDRSSHRMWVHGRAGLPCHRCRSPVRQRTLGEQERRAFWCPRCQPARVVPPEVDGAEPAE